MSESPQVETPDTMTSMDSCVGIDGCRGGWVVARRGGTVVVDTLDAVFATARIIGIDMPIGLPDGPRRSCDAAARAFLGPRRSSVFPTPSRPVVATASHPAANELSRSLHGIGVSAQSFNLFPKIRHVDELLREVDPADRDDRVIEVHPECSFRAMTGTVLPPKRTSDGVRARQDAVEAAFGIRIDVAPRGAALDDVLDAHAVLWTAERFERGDHVVLTGDVAERDALGLPMRIVV